MSERVPTPKELLTALRGVRRKFGGKLFDAAVKSLATGELTLKPGKRGRPGLGHVRTLYSWAWVTAHMEVYQLSDEKAAEAVAKTWPQFHVVELNGPGDVPIVRQPTKTSKARILKLYRTVEKLRATDQNFAASIDDGAQQATAWLALKKNSSGQ